MKKSIKNVLFGLLMVPALLLGLSSVSPFATTAFAIDCSNPATLSAQDALTCANPTGPTCLFGKDSAGKDCVLNIVINVALYFVGALSVLMLILGGIKYILSGGNEKSVTAAKNTILYAVVGVIISVLAFAIVNFVLATFK